jgi:hypothetical protein
LESYFLSHKTAESHENVRTQALKFKIKSNSHHCQFMIWTVKYLMLWIFSSIA